MKKSLKLSVTLCPSFPHFAQFARDSRIEFVRLNSAQVSLFELETELAIFEKTKNTCPMYFDVKARQPRISKVTTFKDHYEIELNHPIQAQTPTPILFKAGVESALLMSIEDEGRRLVLSPYEPAESMIYEGESVHIRHPSYKMLGPVFTEVEKAKIERVRKAGFKKYFLSYVEAQSDIDEFFELVGADSEVMLKIETEAGLRYALTQFKKKPNLTLVNARGDLYVEINRPARMPRITKELLAADPEGVVGSRILLSTIHKTVADCVDFSELAWLYDIGYRNMMLCDEMCTKEVLLSRAMSAFDEFRRDYVK